MQTFSQSKKESLFIFFLKGLLITGFFILITRLIDLQIIEGTYYRSLTEGNRIRRIEIDSPRGKILARGGEVLVGNRDIKKMIVFDDKTGFQKVIFPDEKNQDLIVTEWIREYHLKDDFAHLSGFLNEVKAEELNRVKAECPEKGPLKLGALVGRGGLEEKYDCSLRGFSGEEFIEVDADGSIVRILGKREPKKGNDIKTSIDINLQKKVAEVLKESKFTQTKSGALVITDGNGNVLALYSFPSFDPNVFEQGNPEKISSILNEETQPMINRVISGRFLPGSIYKPIVAISALEEKIIDENYTFDDRGVITINTLYGNFTYKNWYFSQYGKTEGKIGLVRAIARSTDTFFYKLGEIIGVEKLNEWSHKFGLNQETGIDLPAEIVGTVPSPIWKLREKGEKWFLGNTYHLAIGQGDIALTPIGIHSAIAAIASDGKYCQPKVVSSIEQSNGQLAIFQCKNLNVSKENIKVVKQGMIAACSSGGTGFPFFDFKQKFGIDVACKTGTAETGTIKNPHSWFTA